MKEFGIHIAELKPEFCSNNILPTVCSYLTKGEIRDLSEGERKNLANSSPSLFLKIFLCAHFYSDLQPAIGVFIRWIKSWCFMILVRQSELMKKRALPSFISCFRAASLYQRLYTPFELLVAMGFNEKKLVHLREQIPSVLKKFWSLSKTKGALMLKMEFISFSQSNFGRWSLVVSHEWADLVFNGDAFDSRVGPCFAFVGCDSTGAKFVYRHMSK